MAEKLVIQLLEEMFAKPVEDDNGDGEAVDAQVTTEDADTAVEVVGRRFRWGFVDDLSNWHAVAHEGTDEEMLSALSHQSQPAVLLVPGDKVVTLPVAYNKKEARHFLKLLPYQVEDDVLGPVEELFFAVGSRDSEVVTAAYVEEAWLSQLLHWLTDKGMVIDRCIAEYQSIKAESDELMLWFTDGAVWGHRANGLGFSIAQSLSQPFLKDLLVNQQDMENPWNVTVFVDDAETKEIIQSHIMPAVDYEVIIGQPLLSFGQDNQLNFCRGKYGKKLPVDRWWQEAKPLALLAAAALVVFFVTTFADIYLMRQQQAQYQQQLITDYRTVVPRGPASDPTRRLRSMLGSEVISQEPSQSIYLLSKVAPVMQKLQIDLATLNYNHREQALRINVSAKSFGGIEQFRQQLNQQGVTAELQSSNAVNEGYQARLRITLKEALRSG